MFEMRQLSCTMKSPALAAGFFVSFIKIYYLTIDKVKALYYNNITTSTPLFRKVRGMKQIQQLLGSYQPAKNNFRTRCTRCDADIETSHSDIGMLVEEQTLNGVIRMSSGDIGFQTKCCNCGKRVVFPTGRSIAHTTEW